MTQTQVVTAPVQQSYVMVGALQTRRDEAPTLSTPLRSNVRVVKPPQPPDTQPPSFVDTIKYLVSVGQMGVASDVVDYVASDIAEKNYLGTGVYEAFCDLMQRVVDEELFGFLGVRSLRLILAFPDKAAEQLAERMIFMLLTHKSRAVAEYALVRLTFSAVYEGVSPNKIFTRLIDNCVMMLCNGVHHAAVQSYMSTYTAYIDQHKRKIGMHTARRVHLSDLGAKMMPPPQRPCAQAKEPMSFRIVRSHPFIVA